MFWERDVLARQEQMKDRMRQREENRLLSATHGRERGTQHRPRRLDAILAIRTLRRKLLAS